MKFWQGYPLRISPMRCDEYVAGSGTSRSYVLKAVHIPGVVICAPRRGGARALGYPWAPHSRHADCRRRDITDGRYAHIYKIGLRWRFLHRLRSMYSWLYPYQYVLELKTSPSPPWLADCPYVYLHVEAETTQCVIDRAV